LTRLMIQYSYLQVLDFLTTVAFLLHGGHEGNPLVRWAMGTFSTPLVGLLAVKFAAMCLGVWCCVRGRDRVLDKINLFFAILITWNILAIILQPVFAR
jgi:Domain of unknown function (DUF5658)